MWERLKSPRVILLGALALFLIYAWPGFIGWDTRDHMLQARLPEFSNGHPPFVILVVRICDFFVRGPALVLLVQATTLLLGLYLLFSKRLTPLAAAIAAAAVFLFPPIAGVTALIAKDGLMAGFLIIGIALLLDDKRQQWAVLFILIASLMRWNSLPATFAPMLLLYKLRPGIAGVKRYAAALGMWIAVTVAAFSINTAMTTRDEHFWHWSEGYEDIAGTIEYAHLDDATVDQILAGTPLRFHDHLDDRFHRLYNPTNFYQLWRDGDERIWEFPTTDAQRDAIVVAWKKLVLEYPRAYLKYRVDNFRLLNQIDHPEAFSNVYVWFTVIGAPTTAVELQHDAAPSRAQSYLIRAAMWFSLTPVYWVFWYFALCFILLPFGLRRALVAALALSGIGYQLSWFFLAQSTDYRYSSWMELCSVIAAVLVGADFVTGRRARRSLASRRTGLPAADQAVRSDATGSDRLDSALPDM